MLKAIVENFADEEIIKADGFDGAVIGIEENEMRLIYSTSKCLNILQQQEGMSQEDAMEHFTFNVTGAYIGPKTPIWCWDSFL